MTNQKDSDNSLSEDEKDAADDIILLNNLLYQFL